MRAFFPPRGNFGGLSPFPIRKGDASPHPHVFFFFLAGGGRKTPVLEALSLLLLQKEQAQFCSPFLAWLPHFFFFFFNKESRGRAIFGRK